MNSINIIGRLTRDVELVKTITDMSVGSFTIAVDNRGKDKGTSFIPVKCFGITADSVAKYTTKGSLVAVSGCLSQRSYQKKDGTKTSIIEVIADNVQFLDAKEKEVAKESLFEEPSELPLGTNAEKQPETNGIEDDDLPF